MNLHRPMVIAGMTCAASLSLAACSAGITTASLRSASPPATSPARSSPATAPSHTASPAPSPVDTVSVDAPIGSFPVPHGAQVVANMACGKQIILELSKVTPAQVARFYTSALPSAGYKIKVNTLTSDPNTGNAQGLAEITFAGHRYTGLIIALANLGAQASADPSMASLPSSIRKNALEITLSPPGTANTSGC